MSNSITAFFKGRAGVAESVYQYDYGKILIIDGLILPATFEVHFTTISEDDAITVIGQNNRVAIPDSCINKPGTVTAYIYLHTGDNDGETEYIIKFSVIRRARPDYDEDDKSDWESAASQALAMLQNSKKVNTPLDEYNQVDNGTAGQLLRTKGDGSTEWVNEGLPTDEQTQQAVSEWLDEHPEASTTVQDGSLTEAKFTNTLKLKTFNSYITPEMFGAAGDGVTDDHDALYNCIKYAYDNRTMIDASHFQALTIVMKNKYYNGSVLEFGGENYTSAEDIQIKGYGGYIKGYGFHFNSNAGWKIHIDGLNFIDIDTLFLFDERNAEYGDYLFENIEFTRVKYPFIMNRRSCMVEIRNCYFKNGLQIGEFTTVDRLNFHHNWIEPSSNLKDVDYYSLLKQNAAEEGAMFVYNNLFVPVGGSNCKELCWIEVNEHARIYNNRFGGENSSYHPLRIGADFLPKDPSDLTSKYPYISFDHNDEVSGYVPIILESIAGNMLFTENQGWLSGNKILVWSDKLTSEEQSDLISEQARMLNLVVRDNVGRTFYRNGNGTYVPDAYIPPIPTNLYGLLNRGLHAITANTGENAAWLEYVNINTASSVDLIVHDQPFAKMADASDGGDFVAKCNFAILINVGYGYSSNYDTLASYGLITFELEGTTLTPHLTWLGETLPITVSINGSATADVSSLYQQNTLTITLTADSNALKRIKAQIFNPHNQLGCYV